MRLLRRVGIGVVWSCLVVGLYVWGKRPIHRLREVGEARLIVVEGWVWVKSCVVDCFGRLCGCLRSFFCSFSLFFFLFGAPLCVVVILMAVVDTVK